MFRNVAEVVIDGAAGSFDKRYTYFIPDFLKDCALPGCRVTVPFGRGNISKIGMILAVKQSEDTERAKELLGVTDESPVLNAEMLALCEWMHEHTFCTYFDAVKAMLPAGLGFKLTPFYDINPEFAAPSLLSEQEREVLDFLKKSGITAVTKLEKSFSEVLPVLVSLEEKQAVLKSSTPVRRMGDVTRRWVCIEGDSIPEGIKLTPRQKEIAELVFMAGSISVKELQYFTGASASVIDALEKKGIIKSFEKEELRPAKGIKTVGERKEIILTDEQQAAFVGLYDKFCSEKGEAALLYGVTGSGKTQVFLKLVDKASDAGLGVIVMVPEIALTPQMIDIFTSRYGDKIAVFHSAMSIGRRLEEYKRIKQGKALIAIGTRSAVFAPFEKLGLIIIDEEQEHTYKSEKSPRFHAKELARFRTAYHSGLLCLASATPSLESFSAAKSGKLSLYRLDNRYGDAKLPQVSVVDMRKEILSGNSSSISRELAEAVYTELENKRQVILLLNRRGHNTYVSCPSCGWVAECPNCSVSLTYHSANKRLMCHYCGYSDTVKSVCPECGSEHIRFMGAGTQKLEEELHLLFPKARVLRLDADSTMTRDSHSVNLNAFANGEYDIMLGTQMVAKGLDFPNVSLVGVIGADSALYSEDYRGFERTFSLLTQVVGRAGRAGGQGRAIVQTVDPSGDVIELAARQDYDAFYDREILTRKLMIYPPYCDICMVWTQSADRALAKDAIDEIFSNLKAKIAGEYADIKLIILGPCAASVPKVNNRFRFRMIIKCRNTRRFRELLRESIGIRLKRDVSVAVDINPENTI